MVRRVGLATTRIFLGHSPDSQTLERYYLNMMETFDNVAILTEQEIASSGVSKQRVQNFADLALGSLENEALQATRGRALAAMTTRLILADPEPPQNLSAVDLKNYRRRVRAVAHKLLIDHEQQLQQQNITKVELERRKRGLGASDFASKILSRALEAQAADDASLRTYWLNNGVPQEELEDANDEDGSLFVKQGEESDGDAAPEAKQDLERTIEGPDMPLNATGAFNVNYETEVDTEGPDLPGQAVLYVDVARSFMELLLENTLTTHST